MTVLIRFSCPRSNECPLSDKRPSHSNKRLYSVSVIALLEYMYLEINQVSSSFKPLTLSLVTKTMDFVIFFQLFCPRERTVPSNE